MTTSSTVLPEPSGFAELSKAEQGQYVQNLWDCMAGQPETLPVPESHLERSATRLTAHQSAPAPSTYAVLDCLGGHRP